MGSGDSHDDDEEVSFRRLHHTMNHADGSNIVEVGGTRRINTLVALRQDDEHTVALLNFVDQLDGAFASNGERNDGVRKNNSVANREDRQLFRNGLDLLLYVVKLFKVAFHESPGENRML